ncbi:malto-oligosyltrehalose synthase [Mucilaginibacter terrae]|uniref:4-alpha-glucanotransferase n=1 Tax=Mucilaginibacter terrae TaxID=1955052 RepID=A0ABU3GZL5_9SPHI|nr:malto-oligosyltrehalose synthase [Mucilaginibacter terrae]MDT3405209.1 malto-oligosyltrehalose synthase/4-alpha-glucanotransferase [Mucilaginibacter terrae]
MNNPVATYRLQFNSTFTFDDFERIIPYLQKLGVSTIYASPVFEAVPGSTHGYDGVNPHHINPEIGTEKQLKAISAKLQKDNIGWLQDIVPNHMGFHHHNPWLMDVLEKGKLSLYATFFDATWSSALFKDEPLMVPFLGSNLAKAIANNELILAYEQQQGLVLQYAESWYPLSAASYISVLQAIDNAELKQVQSLVKSINTLPTTDVGTYAIKWQGIKQKLIKALNEDDFKQHFEQCLNQINQNKEQLTQLANNQAYRLCNWQETDQSINFRRFFTVNGLICLNIQDKAVFDHFHQFIKHQVQAGVFQGLRIDHIDGLYDPSQYLERLRQLAGEETYIVAEKILEHGEELPTEWPLQGTSGYDYLAILNNLFTNPAAKKRFTAFYEDLVDSEQPISEQIKQKKAAILFDHMGGELENLYQLFKKLRLTDKKILSGLDTDLIKKAIAQLLILCPVYRYYGNQLPLQNAEYDAVKAIFKQAKQENKELRPALNLLEIVLLEKPKLGSADYNQRAVQFYQRLMQFSGPLMAKGVEDTLMYTYNRFIGHNEVGDAPEAFGIGVKEFHKLMKQRQKQWPVAINGTSTHDTKRGEDVRARLNALTDLSKTWLKTVKQWQEVNADLKTSEAPDPNDEYFIYQTLVGAYPMPGEPDDNFAERLKEYLTKALREAKTNSNWAHPDEEYEKATLNFATALLDQDGEFWPLFLAFQQKIADYGIVNSLAQVLIKFTSPGVPDVYQGTELWDLSLVDPDNRRPVNYDLRNSFLEEFERADNTSALLNNLWETRYNGAIKQFITHKLFAQRREQAGVFANGSYIPLKVKGAYDDYIIAYARRYQQQWYITIAPVNLAELCRDQDRADNELKWRNTRVILPPEAPAEWQNIFTGTTGKTNENSIRIKDVFKELPLALLKMQSPESNRGAGILMHITSLPSPFGVGDLGPEAYNFADSLSRSGQKYWQLLPLNPTGAEQQFSPYSSVSSMAGNTLLISPALLVEAGLLSADDIKGFQLPVNAKVNYTEAQHIKNQLLSRAYQNFTSGEFKLLSNQFEQFKQQEAYWLDDFAIYMALKQNNNNEPWYEWPAEYRQRKAPAIKRFATQHEAEITELKWQQFIFERQWADLKAYCQQQNITLFGDIPFYVSHDSVDVWANPDSFSLNTEGQMLGVAGVPPDYFNADGQLWSMPVYRWDAMKARGYDWWIKRLRKNMQLFELIRLDHFRAFSAYWEVPAGDETAKNGKWKPGPGRNFFISIKQALGKLPFVAEDLGEIDEPVFNLRDEFELPGMKILQFAFGDDVAASLYIPHNYAENYLVYTGTHDNNTTVGWFNQDVNKSTKKQIEQYTGQSVKAKNIHDVLARQAYSSTAKIAILPLQDVIGLDETARMNNPSSVKNNWVWRLTTVLDTNVEEKLLQWVRLYHRV